MSGYPFVQAHDDYGKRKGPVLAFLIHMAEGGGTVGFLSRENARGVSVHYVIEYSGRIVQMLHEDRASGSVNPRDIRTSDGPAPYGHTAAKAVLGAWANDPNSAVISLEIEGFAKDGPNAKQQAALKALINDVRSRHPGIGLLGHRDFADYKACPGAHIPWDELGGHGPAGEDMAGVKATAIGTTKVGVFRATAATPTIPADGSTRGALGAGAVRSAIGPYGLTDLANRPSYLLTEDGKPSYVAANAGTFTEAGSGNTTTGGDCSAEVAAAITADRAKARITYP